MKNILLLTLLLTFNSCGFLINKIGGNFNDIPPKEMNNHLSIEAKQLVEDSFLGIKKECLSDTHLHIAGLGKDNSGIWINPDMKTWTHFYKKLQFEVYLSASGLKSHEHADSEYVKRVLDLLEAEPRLGKAYILAFDKHYKKNGEEDLSRTNFYVPSEYVVELAAKYPQHFIPVVSVHPYRKDAIQKLTEWGEKGIRFVKWLPNAMGMNPGDQSVIPFYKVMKKYNMALITHTGEEKAVDGEEFQFLGNPLLLKLPLNLGVKVIASHVASLGGCKDFENGDVDASCFDLFWRMFNDKKYQNNFFADLSAITIHTRLGHPVDTILAHPELHNRLMNGSDYPLPAINIIYKTGQLADMGYITKKERELINEIYKYNPLLFDFVLKRTMKHPVSKLKLTPSAFEVPEAFGCK